uniref:Uncharacterized protein n=1 Tax=Arundo donax TaxID=35708 RepID=A0A0A9CEG9_ARUDO
MCSNLGRWGNWFLVLLTQRFLMGFLSFSFFGIESCSSNRKYGIGT